MKFTASQITKYALKELELRKCNVWRQNQSHIKGRKFIGKLGMPDIIGYHKFTAIAVYCEVKTISDKFSAYQIEFLNKAKTSGCHCLIATEKEGTIIIEEYKN